MDDFLQRQYARLARRKEHKGFVPTNTQLKAILDDLAQDEHLINNLSWHKVDLVEIAAVLFFAKRRDQQIRDTAKELVPLQAANKKRTQRAKQPLSRGELRPLTPPQLRRILERYSVRQRRELLRTTLQRLLSSYPGIVRPKQGQVRGRRQNISTKIAHFELDKYFARKPDPVPVSQRDQWIQRILVHSQLFFSSDIDETFHKKKMRLRMQFPSLRQKP